MPVPLDIQGTPPRRRDSNRTPGGASQPDVNSKGGKKAGGNKYSGTIFEIDALNPPFDSRMRRIGSPLNRTNKIKRGWIQSASEDNPKRVNFLFNPPALNVSAAVSPGARMDRAVPETDVMDQDMPSSGVSTGVQLLYDRTYELFSAPRSGETGFANNYGVWADVAAWYTFLGMLPEMPDSWENSMITDPMHMVSAFLFVGPRVCHYGYVSSFNVVYSHWTQNMVPARCAVDIGFTVLPFSGETPLKGGADANISMLPGFGWDWMDGTSVGLSPTGDITMPETPEAESDRDNGSWLDENVLNW